VLHENASLLWIQRVEGINYDGSKLSDYQYEVYEYGNEEESDSTGPGVLGSDDSQLPDVEGRVDA